MISIIRTNARLRAENSEKDRVLRLARECLVNVAIDQLKDEQSISRLTAELSDANGLIKYLREYRDAETRLISRQAVTIHDLEARIERLVNPPRDPVTGKFLKVGA